MRVAISLLAEYLILWTAGEKTPFGHFSKEVAKRRFYAKVIVKSEVFSSDFYA